GATPPAAGASAVAASGPQTGGNRLAGQYPDAAQPARSPGAKRHADCRQRLAVADPAPRPAAAAAPALSGTHCPGQPGTPAPGAARTATHPGPLAAQPAVAG